MKVYILERNVKWEGPEIIDIYECEEQAEAECEDLNTGRHPSDVSYRVTPWPVIQKEK